MKKIIFIIAVCISVQMYAQEVGYNIRNLDVVNTELSDFGTSNYNNQIVFASAFDSTGKRKWNGNNQPFLDLFVGDIGEEGEIINQQQFPNRLNTKYHESNAAFTKDLKTVYFSRNNYINGQLYQSDNRVNNIQMYRARVNDDGKWIDIKPMPFNSRQYETGHPTLNVDENRIYFTSNMPGTVGRTDIWYVDILNKDADFDDVEFGEPVNLGPEVNSAAKEMFPNITASNTLYYSSNKGGGIGGLDVYKTTIGEDGTASEATILPKPINSLSDDFSFLINEDTKTGYFSSNRLGGKGSDDIYYFEEVPAEEIIEVVEEVPCTTKQITGVVKDKYSGELIPRATVEVFDEKYKSIQRVVVGDDAAFSIDVPCDDAKYRVVGSKANYTRDVKSVEVTPETTEIKLGLGIGRAEIVGNQIKINNIYFDFDKSFIRSDAAVQLDRVVAVMQAYPQIKIESGSHTDSRGRDSYNMSLSQRRAKSTVDYIISRGIDKSRITHRGYGETRLTNQCSNGVKCSEEEHQMNRRTEFIIVNPEVLRSTNTTYIKD